MTDKLLEIMQTLQKFLAQSFLSWQLEQGEIKTVEEYANYLSVNRSLLSFWMNGKRVPNEENLQKLSSKLGNEIYDVMGLPRPNPYKQVVDRVWEFLPEEIQKRFSEEAAEYETKEISERVSKSSKQRKPLGNDLPEPPAVLTYECSRRTFFPAWSVTCFPLPTPTKLLNYSILRNS